VAATFPKKRKASRTLIATNHAAKPALHAATEVEIAEDAVVAAVVEAAAAGVRTTAGVAAEVAAADEADTAAVEVDIELNARQTSVVSVRFRR
jgi:hypothetical protein